MNYTVVVPYWGDGRYAGLLEKWFTAFAKSGCTASVRVLTDHATALPDFAVPHAWRVTPADVPQDPAFAFDYKGALVCAAITQTCEPMFVVDADALIVRDPTAMLAPFADAPFAMPLDEGAWGKRLAVFGASKRCAGVLWFGQAKGLYRAWLVRSYVTAFNALEGVSEERRLREQHAWTLVAELTDAPVLPRELNWADHLKRVGPNDSACVLHRIGEKKWSQSAG